MYYFYERPVKDWTGLPTPTIQRCGSCLHHIFCCLFCPNVCWWTSPLSYNSQIPFNLQGNRELMMLPNIQGRALKCGDSTLSIFRITLFHNQFSTKIKKLLKELFHFSTICNQENAYNTLRKRNRRCTDWKRKRKLYSQITFPYFRMETGILIF